MAQATAVETEHERTGMGRAHQEGKGDMAHGHANAKEHDYHPVSYTHLTLPTIYSV